MPLFRTRLAVALISSAAIALQLALMRELSLRFWAHFAYMVISVALLGFGASGTGISLLRRRILVHPRGWICGLAMAFSLSIPLSLRAGRAVPLDVQYLAWNLSQLGAAAALELIMFIPFLLAGMMVGVALLDLPRRLNGHYAANLVGSGAGALAAVALMFVLTTSGLLMAISIVGYLAAAVLLP
ncbi:MAG: hypothetical protein KAJ01_07750, partial [Candidatus Hydrogenedentes bacterium]|nr:hypothetical protein [Candidatus Hydrogenedentota bacterium]